MNIFTKLLHELDSNLQKHEQIGYFKSCLISELRCSKFSINNYYLLLFENIPTKVINFQIACPFDSIVTSKNLLFAKRKE